MGSTVKLNGSFDLRKKGLLGGLLVPRRSGISIKLLPFRIVVDAELSVKPTADALATGDEPTSAILNGK